MNQTIERDTKGAMKVAKKDEETDTVDAVGEAFPGASETTAEDDFNRPLDNYPATSDGGKTREVALSMPGGSKMPMTVEALKQLSFNDLAGLDVLNATEELGQDQFGPILEDKGKLVGVPFVLLHWEFHAGDFGDFVTMYVLTQSEDRFIVNDGSTGIAEQLRTMTQRSGVDSMLVCAGGFRVSEYDKELPNGKMTKAKTYYIDTALKA